MVLGLQRRAPVMISIAADPTDVRGDRVYVAWTDSTTDARLMLNVSRSDDGGASWRPIFAAANAINPALAVNSNGQLGLLFNQLGGDSVTPRWITRFLAADSGDLSRPREYVLAETGANQNLLRGQPYVGDYFELHAHGNAFIGAFSAANHPAPANFPNGITYQRRIDSFASHLLKRSPGDAIGPMAQVAPSVDPFYFSVVTTDAAQCSQLRAQIAAMQPPVPARNPADLPARAATMPQQTMARIGCLPPR
jgi:hypothetical protein